jgi:hypothetical protein
MLTCLNREDKTTTFERETTNGHTFTSFQSMMKSGNFAEPILQDCTSRNIDITEPLMINNFIDDFLVNPDVESASFMFYNVDKQKPNPLSIMRLQDVVDRQTMVQQMRTGNDNAIGEYPPSFFPESAVNKLERSVLKEADSCDYSFYSDFNNIIAIPSIK